MNDAGFRGAIFAPPEPEGLARDPVGRSLARSLYSCLFASALSLMTAGRGEGWALGAIALHFAAGAYDRSFVPRFRRRVLGGLCVFVLLALWVQGILEVIDGSRQMSHLFGLLAESSWIGAAALCFIDKRWVEARALYFLTFLSVWLTTISAVDARSALALGAFAWCSLIVLQRAQRWRASGLIGREGSGASGLDHGARKGWWVDLSQMWLAASLLLLSTFTALTIYFLWPRFGSANGPGPSGTELAAEGVSRLGGLAEGTSLGDLAPLQQNFEPALIIRPLEDDGGAFLGRLRSGNPYWRGIAHPRYDVGTRTWAASLPLDATPLRDGARGDLDGRADGRLVVGPRGDALGYTQELLLGESRVVFGLNPLRSLSLDLQGIGGSLAEGVRRDREDVFWCVDDQQSGLLSEGVVLRLESGATLSSSDYRRARSSRDAHTDYLELPEEFASDPLFRRSLERIGSALGPKGARGSYSMLTINNAMVAVLHSRCRYSLDPLAGEEPEWDPLLSFLEGPVDVRQGHCVFFATAAALLLRAHDVPTRLVSGFSGGFERGGRWIVSAAHAHAWLEVWCGGDGWLVLDPTPPQHHPDAIATSRLASRFDDRTGDEMLGARERSAEPERQFLDAAGSFFEEISSGEDGARQRALDSLGAITTLIGDRIGRIFAKLVEAWVALLLLVLLAVVTFASRPLRSRIFRKGGSKRGRSSRSEPLGRLYDELLALLARAGLAREPSETPRELSERAQARWGGDIGELVYAETLRFERARYGEVESDESDLAASKDHLQKLRARLHRRR